MALPYFRGSGLKLDVFGLPEFIQGLERAKILQVRFMRGEMSRGLKRIRKSFISTQLKGPPGIKGGELAKGRHVFTGVSGDSKDSIGGRIGISRILNVHEQGVTITPKAGGKLYIQSRSKNTRTPFLKGSKEQSSIVAVVDKVVIPKRLHFREHVNSMKAGVLRKVGEEAFRASEVALKDSMKKVLAKV